MEYINSSLKYLNSESERKLYIHKNYHDRLDIINNKYIIEENIQTMIKVYHSIKLFNSRCKQVLNT